MDMYEEKERESNKSRARREMADDVPEPVKVLGTEVEKGMASATYRIPRASTVEADNKPHKVRHRTLAAVY
jgi:hypothetical protein